MIVEGILFDAKTSSLSNKGKRFIWTSKGPASLYKTPEIISRTQNQPHRKTTASFEIVRSLPL